MRAWRRTFSATAVYIGGVEAGCASPNLTAGWVSAMTGMGWSLMPTYVGRQASCSSFTVRIRPARAVAQGRAAALDAIHQAAALGMGRDTPIYYDMEAYHGHRRCRDATLAFLDAWTRTLHAHGYRSGRVFQRLLRGREPRLGAHRERAPDRQARLDVVRSVGQRAQRAGPAVSAAGLVARDRAGSSSTRARTTAPWAGTPWTSTRTGSTGLFTGNKLGAMRPAR